MQPKPIVGSVVGPISVTHWGQVLLLPNAYGVVEVADEDGVARATGVHLLSVLGGALSENPTSLGALNQIIDETLKDGVRTILLCVPIGHVVYIVLYGGGDVYLRRGQQFARLLQGSGAISGEVLAGDTLILASQEFTRALTQEEAGRIFDHLTPSEVAERLTLLLHEKSYGEGSVALVIQFHEETEESVREKVEDTAVTSLPTVRTRVAAFMRHMSIPALKRDVQRIRNHPKKATAIFTALLIALFGVSVLLGIVKQGFQIKNQAVASAISDAQHAMDEGIALLSLNPVKGRGRLTQAKTLLDPFMKTIPPRSGQGREMTDLYRQISDNLTSAMQVSRVTPELFFDAALVKKGGTISHIGFEDTTMGIIDTTTTTVIALDVRSKKSTVLGGGQTYSGLSYTAIHGDTMYVLVDAGIHMVRLSDNQTIQGVVKRDPQWGVIASLVSYGGNLYLLDTEKSRIWKYMATDNSLPAGRQGFSDTKEYLNPDTLPDFSAATNMAIDGSVWVGTNMGKILKFTQGKEDSFVPKGVDPAFGSTLLIYTNDSVKNLYVLDTKNKRVVILDKDGTYLAQYVWTDNVAPTDFAVSEEQKKMYLLASDKLYTIGLK